MAKKTNNLVTPFSLVPEEMCRAHLEAAYYPGPGEQITPIRAAFWHLQQEGRLNWKIRVIEGTKHLAALMVDWKPDVLVTHWHGEYSAHRRSLPSEISSRLRRDRGEFLGSNGPFLVAQISAADERFEEEPDQISRLTEAYDMVIQRPQSFEHFAKNIAIGIHNAINTYSPLKFDNDFRVRYLV